jgi:hypothetical protein
MDGVLPFSPNVRCDTIKCHIVVRDCATGFVAVAVDVVAVVAVVPVSAVAVVTVCATEFAVAVVLLF